MNPFTVLLYLGLGCTTDCRTICGVKLVSTYDGDTMTFNLPQGSVPHPIFNLDMPVRMIGVDAPEMDSKSTCEAKKAVEAKNFTTDALQKAKSIHLFHLARDKYFRLLADVVVDGRSLNQRLVDAKLAVGYDGGTKLKVDWCKNPPVIQGVVEPTPEPVPTTSPTPEP